MSKPCSVLYCNNNSHAKSLCYKHLWRLKHYNDLNHERKRGRGICVITGCNKFCVGHGWCTTHYENWRQRKDPLLFGKYQEYHGLSKSPEYSSWAAMLTRCFNKNSKAYKSYGGRGIKVCSDWSISFNQFYADMGKMPNKNMSLDRINVDGNYEPSNCRWATRSQQAINTRLYSNNNTGYRGTYKIGNRWTSLIQHEKKIYRLGSYLTVEEAALAFDVAAIQLRGNDAKLNIIQGNDVLAESSEIPFAKDHEHQFSLP